MNIISVPDNFFFKNTNLIKVNISSNYLISFDSLHIYTLSKLQLLDLSYNLFMGLDETFFKAGKVMKIYSNFATRPHNIKDVETLV